MVVDRKETRMSSSSYKILRYYQVQAKKNQVPVPNNNNKK